MGKTLEEQSKEKPKQPQSRHRRRSNKTRARLVDAARTVITEKGLDRCTVDDITERADVGRGTFYNYFENMGDLTGSLVETILTELVAKINARCQDQTGLAEILDAIIGSHMDFFSKRWEDFVLFYLGQADLTLVESYDNLATPFNEYLNCIERLVDSSMPQPISRPALRRLACAIAGFISGYYSFAVISSDAEDVDNAFLSLRSAFVASLVRFISEAFPDTGKKRP